MILDPHIGDQMKLSLVIPVWNDPTGLDRLLRQVGELGLFAEVIVVDDASDEPLGPDNLPAAAALSGRITWLRSDRQRGAGHARNIGLDRVSGSHVIFFDSDDLFAADFPLIAAYAAAEAEPFDFLIFRHDDSRILDVGGQGTFPEEEKYWRVVGATNEPTELTSAHAAVLCQLSAYPWNKIYRTSFLRDNRIRCTETMVHNDVELHWSSFVTARRILACGLTGATHFVQNGGGRLTNRRSADRLEVFRTFENIIPRIMAEPGHNKLGFLLPFVQFTGNLISWISRNIEDDHHPELLARAQRHFSVSLDRRLMTLIAYTDPALARKINRLVLQGALP